MNHCHNIKVHLISLNTLCNFSGRTGKIRVQSLKIGLMSLSKGLLEEKYRCKNLFNKICAFYHKMSRLIMI